jgi:putative ABC transport system permease protein
MGVGHHVPPRRRAGHHRGHPARLRVTLALSDQGLGSFTLPIGFLIIILIGAFLIGVVAAIRPARRAARLDVLRAVTVE